LSRRLAEWREKMSKALRSGLMSAVLAGTLAGPSIMQTALAEEGVDPVVVAAAAMAEKYNVDIKKLFATNCSWCHDGFGMDGGKGPALAGTNKTYEQVVKQITSGKSGYMPGFGKVLKPEQVQALAEYIKSLPAPAKK
jgi:mono/diheme cytochrome c family protein